MAKKVQACHPKNKRDLKEAVIRVWNHELTTELHQSLIESMPRRWSAVIKGRGWVTKYWTCSGFVLWNFLYSIFVVFWHFLVKIVKNNFCQNIQSNVKNYWRISCYVQYWSIKMTNNCCLSSLTNIGIWKTQIFTSVQYFLTGVYVAL